MISNNPCYRCGKQRIISRTYTEIVNGSPVIYTESVCPDPKCQEMLNLQFAEEKAKRERFAANKAAADEARLTKKKNDKQIAYDE